MPIYTYDCPTDGVQDVLFRAYDPPSEQECPVCGGSMSKCVTLPSRVEIKRDWNEKANDYQTHGPYHQAQAQLRNHDRAEQEHRDTPPMKITEEAIQVGAKAIDETKHNPPRSPVLRTYDISRRLAKTKREKEAT